MRISTEEGKKSSHSQANNLRKEAFLKIGSLFSKLQDSQIISISHKT